MLSHMSLFFCILPPSVGFAEVSPSQSCRGRVVRKQESAPKLHKLLCHLPAAQGTKPHTDTETLEKFQVDLEHLTWTVDIPREIPIRKWDLLTQGGADPQRGGQRDTDPAAQIKRARRCQAHPRIHYCRHCATATERYPQRPLIVLLRSKGCFPQTAGRTSPRESLPRVLTQAAPRSAALLPPPRAEAGGSGAGSRSPHPYRGIGCTNTPQAHILLLQPAMPMGVLIPVLKTSFGLSRESHAQQHQSSSPFTGTLLLKHFLGLMEWSRSMEEERKERMLPACPAAIMEGLLNIPAILSWPPLPSPLLTASR